MAHLQRKLVHKQFNSPMGLYSAQNVQETLNRELKAFGSDGIEVDDQILKPANLSNSAVLKALEEEEMEKVHSVNKNTRKSRPRQREYRASPIIDRETVLKINRRAPHRQRDYSWPPPSPDDEPEAARSRTRSTSGEVHFDEKVRKRHEIDHMREVYVRDALKSNENEKKPESKSDKPLRYFGEWPPAANYEKINGSTESLTGRTYCLPEQELHVGKVEPMRMFWEGMSSANYNSIANGKKWKSFENFNEQKSQPIQEEKVGPPRVAAVKPPRQSSSLDRYKPPPKPRRDGSGGRKLPNLHAEPTNEGNSGDNSRLLFRSSRMMDVKPAGVVPANQVPKVVIQSADNFINNNRKNSEVIDCSSNGDGAGERVQSNNDKNGNLNSAAANRNRNVTVDEVNYLARDGSEKQLHENLKPGIIPEIITANANDDTHHQVEANRIYDEACVYLRSIDLLDENVKLRKEEDTATAPGSPINADSDAKKQRRKGCYYTDGEYIWGPSNTNDDFELYKHTTPTPPPEIESLKAIQMSIKDDLKQIDKYMQSAEKALSDNAVQVAADASEASQLQTMIRQIFHESRSRSRSPSPSPYRTLRTPSVGPPPPRRQASLLNHIENVPVVETALLDLYNISMGLSDPDSIISATIIPIDLLYPRRSPSRSQSPARITEITDDTEASSSPTASNEIVQSKNILSGYIISKQNQEELIEKATRTGRARNRPADNADSKIRSISQPPPFEYFMEPISQAPPAPSASSTNQNSNNFNLSRQHSFDGARFYDNASPPSLYVPPGLFQLTEGYKRVAWPPVPENRTVREFTPQPQFHPQQPQLQQQQQPHHQHQPQQHPINQPTNQGPTPSHHHHTSTSYPRAQNGVTFQVQPPTPVQESANQTPTYPVTQTQSLRWAPVRSPVPVVPRSGYTTQQSVSFEATPHYGSQQNLNHQPSAPTYQSVPVADHHHQYEQPGHLDHSSHHQDQVDFQQHPSYQSYSHEPLQQYNLQAQAYRGESPGIITLRKEAPITQRPAPVYSSQPVARSYRGESEDGGANMRGDLKWPPAEYKQQSEVDNEERRKLALGPAFRPRRVNKDYTQFFAKNAINNYYPSYKVPPGTQHVGASY